MNHLDIDPTELRGIGIQVNKLESCTTKKTGLIENFISNMKSDTKINDNNLSNEKTDNEEKLSKITDTKNNQKSSIMNNIKLKPIENQTQSNTMNFFKPEEKSYHSKQQTSTVQSTSNVMPHQSLVNIKLSQIDPEFLNALPPDLRQELENDLKVNEHQNSVSTEHENITATMENTMTEESSRLYQHVHVDQMKEFVEEWVTTENEPKTCDNIMVSEYLCNLIKDTKTEDAYEIIRKLYR